VRAAAALVLLAACGYTVRTDHGESPGPGGGLPSTAVLPFDNDTFRRGLEISLSRRIADEVRARSPRSPEGPKSADWLLTGTITRAFERVLSEDTNDSVRESSFWMTCEFVLRDRATDRIIGTNTLTKFQSFSDRKGRFRTAPEAAEEVIREIAEATVYWLEQMAASPRK
jgi:hypothetical protein